MGAEGAADASCAAVNAAGARTKLAADRGAKPARDAVDPPHAHPGRFVQTRVVLTRERCAKRRVEVVRGVVPVMVQQVVVRGARRLLVRRRRLDVVCIAGASSARHGFAHSCGPPGAIPRVGREAAAGSACPGARASGLTRVAQLGEELVERVHGVRVAAALSLAAVARRVRRRVTSPFAVSAR